MKLTKSKLKEIIREEINRVNEYTKYSGDPLMITAKYPGVDMYGVKFKKGEKILYYPKQPNGKNVIAGKRAETEYRKFVASAEDEDFYMSQY